MSNNLVRWAGSHRSLKSLLSIVAIVLLASACSGAGEDQRSAAGGEIGAVATTARSSVVTSESSVPAIEVETQPIAGSEASGEAPTDARTSDTTAGDTTTGSSATPNTTAATSSTAVTSTAVTSTAVTSTAVTSSAVGNTAGTSTAAPSTAGNPGGGATVPAEGQAIDTSNPSRVIGNGSPGGCTGQAVVDAVATGGIITFDCGPDPIVIEMSTTAKVVNANGPEIVIDGGGKVTLSGRGQHRILYMNTCDRTQGFTTSHCQNQDHPRLTVQNLTFADGNATGETAEGGGGGAIFVRGGRLKIVNSTFARNRCDTTGPDVGGAAVRVLSQYEGRPVYVVNSTFGGAPGQGGVCSNGGAISSIGVSWVVLNTVMTHNDAIGNGANPAKAGTPGGGSGGAIYLDGNLFTIDIRGSRIEDNHANEGGGAVFFVSNNRTGTMSISDSIVRRNPSDGFETQGYPGIFFLGAADPSVSGGVLE